MHSNLEGTVCIPYSVTDFLYNHKQATHSSVNQLYSNSHQLHETKKDSAVVLSTMSWTCSNYASWPTD